MPQNGDSIMNPYLKFGPGGPVDPKKKVVVDGKEMEIGSDEYRKLYGDGSIMSVDSEGMPTMYVSDSEWDNYFESERKRKGEVAARKGTSSFIKETSKLIPGNPNEKDTVIENILEVTPTPLGRLLSADDALLAGNDLFSENKQGTVRNIIDIAGVSPYLKLGNNTIKTDFLDNAAKHFKKIKGRNNVGLETSLAITKQLPNTVNYGIPIEGLINDIKEDSYRTGGSVNPYIETAPIEIEASERIYDKNGNLLFETPADAPKHEQGGVKLDAPVGSFVFPKKYFGMLDVMSTLPEFNKIKNQMLSDAEKAYKRGEKYSSGGKPV